MAAELHHFKRIVVLNFESGATTVNKKVLDLPLISTPNVYFPFLKQSRLFASSLPAFKMVRCWDSIPLGS